MKKILKKIPLVKKIHRHWQEQKYESQFSSNCYGCFRGVYTSFDEAITSAPKTKPVGYDDVDLAVEYKDNLPRKIASYDYPVLFWLKTIFSANFLPPSIFDFGGNVGTHFYAYSNLLEYPEGLKYIICDVPQIIKTGQQLAKERKVNLEFTTKFAEANGKSIFIASGSIQYVESLSLSLSLLDKLPVHLLINRLPLYDGKQFVSLQNGGRVFYPQYIFNRQEFIGSLNQLGYQLIDTWEDRVDSCMIPFYPEYSVPVYSGLYLKLKLQKQ
ncbi:MAG: methyltransferase, TIGR04325 family [Dolichospermum sp.]